MINPVPPWQALLVEEKNEITLIVADLHLGFENELVEMGINIPSQTPKIQEKLVQIIKYTKPKRLIILGDLKHNVPKISLHEWEFIPRFFENIQKVLLDVEIIPGNHDGNLELLTPKTVRILSPRGIVIGEKEKVALMHGHAWPSPELLGADFLIIAHNHPTVHFIEPTGFRIIRQIWVKADCDGKKLAESFLRYNGVKDRTDPIKQMEKKYGVKVRNPKLIMIPSFNETYGGLPINLLKKEKLLGPILRSGAVDMDAAEAYLLDGTFLGSIRQLRRIR
ncbi:MAG TPA: metallophosphoesterase [archaeon]|nr:metallophosphoesterase [archaeon]